MQKKWPTSKKKIKWLKPYVGGDKRQEDQGHQLHNNDQPVLPFWDPSQTRGSIHGTKLQLLKKSVSLDYLLVGKEERNMEWI